MNAENDLIEVRVVVDRVGVHPVRLPQFTALKRDIIDVDLFGMVRSTAVIWFFWIDVLDQMIPGAPAPDHFATRFPGRVDLEDGVDPHLIAREQCWMATDGEAFFLVLLLPCDHQEIAVGKRFDVMVRDVLFRSPVQIPGDFARP